ncbi:MAG: hypothetical protein KAS92_08205 [Candidatus Omnitrophica bacterium]|nr:hypothetical protein [Candidatus Omnitrophota bacterium]
MGIAQSDPFLFVIFRAHNGTYIAIRGILLMAVYRCSEEGCERHISISNDPGGNSQALSDYEAWAFLHGKCGSCGYHICDRCVNRKNIPLVLLKCPKCDSALGAPEYEKNIRITRHIAEQAWSDKDYRRVVGIFEIFPLFGTELTPAEEKKRDFSKKRVQTNQE